MVFACLLFTDADLFLLVFFAVVFLATLFLVFFVAVFLAVFFFDSLICRKYTIVV